MKTIQEYDCPLLFICSIDFHTPQQPATIYFLYNFFFFWIFLFLFEDTPGPVSQEKDSSLKFNIEKREKLE